MPPEDDGTDPADRTPRPSTPPPTPAVAAPPRKPLPRIARWLLMAFAWLCVVLGLIGVIVPGMPTTVFILMAAWAAARSSPRMHAWLYAHRLFGPLLRDWDDGGRVSRRVKWIATLTMGASAREAMATRARLHVERHFSLERMVEDTLDVYISLLEGGRKAVAS